ncbi:MAG: SHOCT domain-containing protein [Chloroflexi bacterium]|nr:SHOCT domain-containing protein [Chloroflexota bacterium]
MMGGFGIGGGLMGIFWIVILGLIVWAVVSWGRGSTGNSDAPRSDPPLEILKKRYARGEISKEEFEERKKDLV